MNKPLQRHTMFIEGNSIILPCRHYSHLLMKINTYQHKYDNHSDDWSINWRWITMLNLIHNIFICVFFKIFRILFIGKSIFPKKPKQENLYSLCEAGNKHHKYLEKSLAWVGFLLLVEVSLINRNENTHLDDIIWHGLLFVLSFTVFDFL